MAQQPAAPATQRKAKTITGKVTNQAGEPLQDVSVTVKGRQSGVLTNEKGMYSIAVPDNGNAVLVFSYVGAQDKELKLTGATAILNVKLDGVIKDMDEVVVVGYGTVKKKDLTGAVAQVNMDDLKKAPVNSFEEALAGRVAGVQVTSSDGQPGNDMNIVIRGNNSVTQDNAPLYVIDGFPTETSSANLVNPEEVESIEVLKDASATAIYGARGANGVILITTKKGKVGAPVVTYDGWVGFHQSLKQQEMMNPYEFVKYQLELNPTVYTPVYLKNGKTIEDYKNVEGTNWQDLIFRDAFVHNHSLALRGGNDKTRYSLSGSVLDQDGIIINSGFRRYQGRIVVDQTVTSKVKVGVNINYSATKKYGTVAAEAQASPTATLMYSVWGFRPVTGDSTADASIEETLFDPSVDPATDMRVNPVLSVANEYNPAFNNTLVINSYLEYKLSKYLTLRVTGGVTKTQLRREIFNNSKTRSGNPRTQNNGVNGSIANTDITNLLNENTLTYNRRFNKDHNLAVVAGITMQDVKSLVNGFTSVQVPNEVLGIKGLGEGVITQAPTSAPASGLLSYLARVNYGFKSKYLVTFSFRADGSSRFPKDNRWAYFPSGAFAWRFVEEKFMRKMGFISDAKLRVGYGATGNNRVGDFSAWPSLQITTVSGYSNGNVAGQGMIPTNLGNAKLKWETTTQADVGLDLGFMKNRITFTADYYKKNTSNLLLNATLAPSQGFLTGYKNIGKVSNEGIEFTLNTRNVERKNFSWSTSFNISFNRNKVVSLNEGEPSLATRVTWGNFNSAFPYIAIPGRPIALFYGMLFDGVYQYSDFNQLANGSYVLKDDVPNNGNPRANIQPGHIKFKDINGDGQIDDYDLTIIGNPNPTHIGGFTNNFTWNNFDLNVFFQWSYGGQLLNANRIEFEAGDPTTRNGLNMFKSWANRWTPDNQTNELYKVGGQGPAYYSSRTIEDGSFLRLKTVSLGYNLPVNTVKRLKLNSIRVYAAAQNLFTWSNYSGLDPEVSTRPGALTPGFDFSAYPRTRTLTLGVNVKF
ncbi:TonB-dependent receptor [Filimonas effusa]|uniref:TonB-dependent receptor n=2 Tax=Filimonas effusa TaxID=2508721 RepID=A0A4Q1DDB3_9BACT|nr:TonB-dependent receptor [Filimonas effusa]